MKKARIILIAFSLFLGLSSSVQGESWRYDYRAIVLGFNPAFQLTILRNTTWGEAEEWVVSGFAPGVGRFSQNVPPGAITIDLWGGTASVDTTIPGIGQVKVGWNAIGSPLSAGIKGGGAGGAGGAGSSEPGRWLYGYEKKAKVDGKIGAFNLRRAPGRISIRYSSTWTDTSSRSWRHADGE